MQTQLAAYADERIQKAAAYFYGQLQSAVTDLHTQLGRHVGTSKELAGKADELLRWVMNKTLQLETFSQKMFSTDAYLDVLRQPKMPLAHSYLKVLNAKPNEALFEQLVKWRELTAQTEGVLSSMIFSEQTLAAIAAKLPETLKALSGIKGVGTEKCSRYGASILTMIRVYQHEASGKADQKSLF